MATTGPALLPDVGTLSYNGVVFSSLFWSELHAAPTQDKAERTITDTEWTLSAHGVVTMPSDVTSTDGVMLTMRNLLQTPGGVLIYKGRGFGALVVNQPGGKLRDVAWGPIPTVIDFKPLGAGASAEVTFSVKTRIPEMTVHGPGTPFVLQFNEESTVTYDDDQYSKIDVKGTLEIPLTRNTAGDRTITTTADALRQRFMDQVGLTFDATRFRITNRSFGLSRDKRSLEWSFSAEELPPMGLPPGCPIAHGTFTVRPAKPNPALVQWYCTLTATYTIRKDWPRRMAHLYFLSLLSYRMTQSLNGRINNVAGGAAGGAIIDVLAQRGATNINLQDFVVANLTPDIVSSIINHQFDRFGRLSQQVRQVGCLLMNFEVSEGLYLDSKTVTFTAGWRLNTSLTMLLRATGVWKTAGLEGGNLWYFSMADITRSESWLANRFNAANDAIVDMGGP